MKITVTVNGTDYTRVVEPRLLLIHFLRDELRLTGSHWGCDTSNCGACVVWLDETPVKSCTVLAVMADGRRVATVEGLAAAVSLDPVQEGFAACHGLQCGFCTPGMLMTARWLLDHNPDPTADEIREAISGQVCRCTGYENIVRSVLWAAKHDGARSRRRRGGQVTMSGAYGPLPRKEDARFIRGQGTFIDDIALPGMLHGAILRSPLAHARIVSVDATAARAHPSVVAVLTGADLAQRGLAWMPTLFGDVQAVLATDKVRFQGQEVAFVVATDRYAARDALELIAVDYEPLPPLMDALTALEPGAPVVREDLPGGNRVFDWRAGDKAATDAAFAAADVVVELRHDLPALAPGPARDLRRHRRLRGGRRQADPVVDQPGPARPPHDVRGHDRAARAQDPGRVARPGRRLRGQGPALPGLRVRDRGRDGDRPAGEVGGGQVGEPDVHRVRPRLPHARRDRRDRRRRDPRPARPGARRPRGVQRGRAAVQVPGRLLPHLHRLLPDRGRRTARSPACSPTRRRAASPTRARSASPRPSTWSSG